MAYAAVISVLKAMENLAKSPRISLAPPSPQLMERAYKDLKSLQGTLQKLDNSSKSNSRSKVNALDARIREAVWEFEDLLETHVYQQILAQSAQNEMLLEVNLEELRHDFDVFTEMLKEKQGEYCYELDNMLAGEAASVPFTTDSGAKKSKVVGSCDVLRSIRLKLKVPFGFNVVPVVGMAGIGKSTISKEIFDDPLLFADFNFECRAWVTIGRMPCSAIDKVRQDILIQLDPSFNGLIMEGGGEKIKTVLKEILEAKRCLIVVDDIWDEQVWDELKTCFPRPTSGASKVLLTTRLRHVGRYAEPRWHDLYTVELLNEEESWCLLRRRVFGEEEGEEDSCPPQLIKAGKKIAKKCDGLPLMIVTVANLLSQAERTAEFWEEVAEDKSSEIFMAAYDKISEVLFPSYDYLPRHLKSCFLHMGVFPQCYEISRFKLLSMWTAEGFLEPTTLITEKEKTRDNCFGRFLWMLLDHTVVMRCQGTSHFISECDDGIKTCRLHSAFWHLCNREATKNKFFHIIAAPADIDLPECMMRQRRLSIHCNILFGMKEVFDAIYDVSTARSLLCYGPYHPYQVPICFNLELLKILDALQIRFYEFPLEALELVFLRYLAPTSNGEVPPSISRLWNLHFLIIHTNMRIKASGVTSYLPVEIWDLSQLKHIQLMGSNLPSPSSTSSFSEGLLTLKGVGPETCTNEVLERMPNLSKLGVEIELHPDDDMKALPCLNNIHVLRKLRSLKCIAVNPKLRPQIDAFPAALPLHPSMFSSSSLRKLHLSGLGYPWEHMNVIGSSLPNLQVLKLRFYAFRGPKWEVKYNMFERLTSLVMEDTDLVHFKVESGGLSQLDSMSLKHCYKLRHLEWEPDLYSAFKIEVIDCSVSAVTFANKIRSVAEDYPKDFIDVSVHSSWQDENLK